jgi:hypothetical protein
MVKACIQSPTEPGVTMACSSLLGGVCRAEYGEVASVTCEGPQVFLGFNCEFAKLDESPGGGTATALASRCDVAGGSYGGHSWPGAHIQAGIGLAAPGRPVRSLVAEDRRRARPDGTGPRSVLGLWHTRDHRGTSGAPAVTKGRRTAGRSAFGSSSAHNANAGIRLWFRRSPAQGSCDTGRLVSSMMFSRSACGDAGQGRRPSMVPTGRASWSDRSGASGEDTGTWSWPIVGSGLARPR